MQQVKEEVQALGSPLLDVAPWWKTRREDLLNLSTTCSPLYVYDEHTISEAVDALKSLSAVDRLFYAIKANPHPEGTFQKHLFLLAFQVLLRSSFFFCGNKC